MKRKEEKKAGLSPWGKRKWLWLMVGICLLASALSASAITYPPGTLVMGSGDSDHQDGSFQTAAFRFPYGLAWDSREQRLLVADTQNHRIRSIDLETREISTLAGTTRGEDRFGFPGGGHQDGDTSEALFRFPRGILVAPNGAVFVADTGNHAIRMIYEDQVTTVAGSGHPGHRDADGLQARFNNPTDLALDQEGNLYVSDTLNHVIRKIDETGTVTTYAGNPGNTGPLFEPRGLYLSPDDTLYLADSGHHQIKQVKDGKITILTGSPGPLDTDAGYPAGGNRDGGRTQAAYHFPRDLVQTEEGTLLISDAFNHRLRSLDLEGHTATPALAVEWQAPSGLCLAEGYLFVADHLNHRILGIPLTAEELQPEPPPAAGTPGEIPVYVDGQAVLFPDVEPFILEGRLRVPLRFIAEEWGADVTWDSATQTVQVHRQGQTAVFSQAEGHLLLHRDRSMVPLRYLSEKLGFEVDWQEESRRVFITTQP